MLKTIVAGIVGAIFALLAPESRAQFYDECPECRDWCGFGPQGDACMGTCQCDAPGSAEPEISFGAIAHSFGDGYSSKVSFAETSADATADVLEHCRKNSGAPDGCKVVTWYVNSCGALAVGDKAYAAIGGGNNSPDVSFNEAEASALAACKASPGNSGCRAEYAGCSNDLTPEEKAANEVRKQAIVDWMGTSLCSIWSPGSPACATLGGAPTAAGAPGQTPHPASQLVQICTPMVQDSSGEFFPAAMAAINSGAMEGHFARIDEIVNAMKQDPQSALNVALSGGVTHAQLVVSAFDQPEKHVAVEAVAAGGPPCAAAYRTSRYDAREWLARPNLSPDDLALQ